MGLAIWSKNANPDDTELGLVLSRCPNCTTLFRVHAEDLRLAGGRVQCGECGVRYDALKSLYDDEAVSQQNVSPSTRAERASALAADRDLSRKARYGAAMPKPSLAGDPPRSGLLPKVFPQHSRWWTGVSALLLPVLLFQLAWFNARELALALPTLQPALAGFCAALRCELLAPPQPLAVEILGRDIREHPKLQGMLLVNLTLFNSAKTNQPFPQLQLDLTDSVGRVVASRRFKPREYLDASVDADKGMPSQAPVHVLMEVAEPQKATKGFEFHVL